MARKTSPYHWPDGVMPGLRQQPTGLSVRPDRLPLDFHRGRTLESVTSAQSRTEGAKAYKTSGLHQTVRFFVVTEDVFHILYLWVGNTPRLVPDRLGRA